MKSCHSSFKAQSSVGHAQTEVLGSDEDGNCHGVSVSNHVHPHQKGASGSESLGLALAFFRRDFRRPGMHDRDTATAAGATHSHICSLARFGIIFSSLTNPHKRRTWSNVGRGNHRTPASSEPGDVRQIRSYVRPRSVPSCSNARGHFVSLLKDCARRNEISCEYFAMTRPLLRPQDPSG